MARLRERVSPFLNDARSRSPRRSSGGPYKNEANLIPLCLGGADDDKNLWPEPRRSLEPQWNAKRKDDFEHRLCEMVGAGELEVRDAQREISEDWTESYRRRFRLRAAATQRRTTLSRAGV